MDLGSAGDYVFLVISAWKKTDKRHNTIPVANKCADIIKIVCMELLELLEKFVFIFIIMNLLQNLNDAAVLQKSESVFPRANILVPAPT